jgi:hypothetical protein
VVENRPGIEFKNSGEQSAADRSDLHINGPSSAHLTSLEILMPEQTKPATPNSHMPFMPDRTTGTTPDRTKPAEYLPNSRPFDESKRTVLVLDDYRETEMFMRGDKGFSHGELNARLTEENGFNAVRMQVGFNKPGYFDIENSLKTVNAGIEDGSLPLGNGDIINISLGLNKTFTEASKVLGIDINAENLLEKRTEILQAMREKSLDHDVPRKTRDWLRQMVGINDQIEALQERGIIVATAEGNKGSDNFNLGLLAADKHYSSLNADGTVADYAAHNSLTTDAQAEINFYARPLDLFDPTPFEQQTGTYKLQGSNIKLPATEFGGFIEEPAPNGDLATQIMYAPASIYATNDGAAAVSNPTEIPLQPLPDDDSRIQGYLAFSERGSSFANAFGIPAEFSTESQRDNSDSQRDKPRSKN